MCPRSIAGVPSSQALPGLPISAPPSVCISDVIGALACGFQHERERPKKKNSSVCEPSLELVLQKNSSFSSFVVGAMQLVGLARQFLIEFRQLVGCDSFWVRRDSF